LDTSSFGASLRRFIKKPKAWGGAEKKIQEASGKDSRKLKKGTNLQNGECLK